jgi:hypothetical protein
MQRTGRVLGLRTRHHFVESGELRISRHFRAVSMSHGLQHAACGGPAQKGLLRKSGAARVGRALSRGPWCRGKNLQPHDHSPLRPRNHRSLSHRSSLFKGENTQAHRSCAWTAPAEGNLL